MDYARTKVWVWFKGGLNGGEWRGGFVASTTEKGVLCQHGDFKDCVVPEWRISREEPTDLKKCRPFLMVRLGSLHKASA
ncbi:hypothetical protein [Synechococcus sp. MIT S9452]|uniref:hypothetical protein n=1 Tax=Synechococcus sp. MIT S9452 TaxID=3082546 RepID=UPI0039A415C0